MKKMLQRILKNKSALITGVLVLAVVVAAVIFLTGPKDAQPGKKLSAEQAAAKSEEFINNFLMPSGSKATITETVEEYGLYKMKIDIGSESPVESYVTKDGKLFFPQAINMEDAAGQQQSDSGDTANAAATDLPKSDKPSVELFVMSYCPYGTQIEKGILPVLETLGDKIDFKLKFVDYAMHEKKEIDENLTQYCIQKETSSLNSYLQCFLKDGNSKTCLADLKSGDKKKVDSCITKTDKEYKVTENYDNKADFRGSYPGFNVDQKDNEKYGVGGSPTLIINGTEASSGRDSASLLSTICSAFNQAPEECNTELNSQSPTAGFGFDYSAASNAASCN
ncbi:MAG: hypothetical protein ACM3PZ_00440 [Bacillota bacterium]